DSALRLVIDYAMKANLGARGLRSIIEEVMHDVMFDAPASRGEKVTIHKRFVANRLSRLD
ncbi:MAG: ATP-dependent Clp protease ATP-binding subunit ClpX, partial [Candidatus Hydrogenedentota bacterium]